MPILQGLVSSLQIRTGRIANDRVTASRTPQASLSADESVPASEYFSHEIC
jgi:hypothetical protein